MRMFMSEILQPFHNSLDIIQPFIQQMSDASDMQIIGGVGTAALTQPNVYIDSCHKEVVVPAGFSLSDRRDDGTLRDVDVLVTSSNPDRVAEIESILQQTVGDRLELSVFGIQRHEVLQRQLSQPFGFIAFKTFLADRYEKTAESDEFTKSLFPFAVTLPVETLDPWTLVIGDRQRIPVPHPGVTIANYMSRSISGVRPRDKVKLNKVVHTTFDQSPEIKEWLIDGPGKSQLELATVIASLKRHVKKSLSLVDGVDVTLYSSEELIHHESYMLKELDIADRRRTLAVASFKANALHFFESHPSMVGLWRRFAERHAALITKNL